MGFRYSIRDFCCSILPLLPSKEVGTVVPTSWRGVTAALLVFVGVALCVSFIFYTIQQSFNLSSRPRVLGTAEALTVNAHTLVEQEKANYGSPVSPVGRPVRLKIPAINVDSAVEYVGLTPEGKMDVPDGPDVVAWYERGQRP